MLKVIRRFIRKVQVLNNRRKLKIEVVFKNKFPRIKIQEKHENRVRWIIRIITFLGIALSVVSFSTWYYSLTVSLVLFIIGWVFQKIIYTYTVLLVQPMPEKWDGSKWSMMIVGKYDGKFFLAFGFNDKEVALDFFNTILYWNNNEFINEDNIKISIVLEDKQNYSVHVHPNIKRDFVIQTAKETEENLKYDKYGKSQTNLVMQMDICKVFPNGVNSAYNILRNCKDEVFISIYDTRQYIEDKPETIELIRPFDDRKILCNHIKVLKRNELDKQKDYMEFYHIPKY